MNNFTKAQIVEILPGLTGRNVQYFNDQGVVNPPFMTSGTGNYRRYDLENLYEYALIAKLLQFRMTLPVIRGALERCRDFARSESCELRNLTQDKPFPLLMFISPKGGSSKRNAPMDDEPEFGFIHFNATINPDTDKMMIVDFPMDEPCGILLNLTTIFSSLPR